MVILGVDATSELRARRDRRCRRQLGERMVAATTDRQLQALQWAAPWLGASLNHRMTSSLDIRA